MNPLARSLSTQRGQRRALALIVLVGLALRLAHLFFLRSSPYFEQPIMDMEYHVRWARALAAGQGFESGEPFFRAPLYPWFLALCMKLFGPGLLAPRLIQAGLGALSVYLTYRLGRRAFSPAAGLWAALAVATSWVLIHFDSQLLIPTLIVPLDLLALERSLALAEDPRPKPAALTGALFGLSAIARPNVLLFMPLLAGWLLWRVRPEWMRGLRLVGATALGCLAPILPITAINVARGDFALISTQAGVNLWIGNNPSSDGSTAIVPGTRGGWWEGREDSVALAEREAGHPLTPSGLSRHYTAKVLDWMRQDPGAFLRHLLWKARLFFLDTELGNNLPVSFFARYYDPLLRFSPVSFALLAALGSLGLVLGLRGRGGRIFPLWGFLLSYAASVIAFFVCSRYRVPILPLLAVFSGHALVTAGEWVRARRLGALGAAALLVAGVAFATTQRPAAVIDPRTNGYLLLGQAALRDDHPSEAEEYFRRALAIYPANVYAEVGLVDAYRREGLFDQAVATAETALDRLAELRRAQGKKAPGEPELYALLGQSLIDRSGPAEAAAALERRLERDPGACPGYEILASIYRAAGQTGALRRLLQAREAAGCH